MSTAGSLRRMNPSWLRAVESSVGSWKSGLAALCSAAPRAASSGRRVDLAGSKSCLERAGSSGGGAADGDDLAAGCDEGCELLEGFDGDAIGGGKDDDGVGAEADFVDGVGVDEVDVIAGGEDGGHERGGDEAGHGAGDGGLRGSEAGPSGAGGEAEGMTGCHGLWLLKEAAA